MSYFDLGVRLMIDTMPCGNTAALAAYEHEQDILEAAHSRRDTARREWIAEQIGCATWRDVGEWGEQDEAIAITVATIAAASLHGHGDTEARAKRALAAAVDGFLTREFDASNSLEDFR